MSQEVQNDLRDYYLALADIWIWAARKYCERAASSISSDRQGWETSAVKAAHRAAAFARLAEKERLNETR